MQTYVEVPTIPKPTMMAQQLWAPLLRAHPNTMLSPELYYLESSKLWERNNTNALTLAPPGTSSYIPKIHVQNSMLNEHTIVSPPWQMTTVNLATI